MITLTHREKTLALIITACLAGWACFAWFISPAVERVRTLNRVIPQKQAEINQLTDKSAEYITLRDSLTTVRTKIAKQQNDFQLLPFLESLIAQCGLTDKVAAMQQHAARLSPEYAQTIVEIKLQNLSLTQLVDFLVKAESSDAVAAARSLYIKKSLTAPDLLDSTIEIYSLNLTGGTASGT